LVDDRRLPVKPLICRDNRGAGRRSWRDLDRHLEGQHAPAPLQPHQPGERDQACAGNGQAMGLGDGSRVGGDIKSGAVSGLKNFRREGETREAADGGGDKIRQDQSTGFGDVKYQTRVRAGTVVMRDGIVKAGYRVAAVAVVGVVAEGICQIIAGIAAILHGKIAGIGSLKRDRQTGTAANVPQNGVAGGQIRELFIGGQVYCHRDMAVGSLLYVHRSVIVGGIAASARVHTAIEGIGQTCGGRYGLQGQPENGGEGQPQKLHYSPPSACPDARL